MSGQSQDCPDEPRWAELWPFVIDPGLDTPEEQETKIKRLRQEGVTCLKLMVVPSACYGCEKNPRKEQPEESSKLVEQWRLEIDRIAFIYDAVKMGLIRSLSLLDAMEFQLLRVYWWELERLKTMASNPLTPTE